MIALPNQSLRNIARCVRDSADKRTLSRFFSDAPWKETQVHDRPITYLLTQPAGQRRSGADSAVIVDATLCEHVGRLVASVDRHYNHSAASYPLAHTPVTSQDVSGPVRFPVDVRLYRRDEEVTRWAEVVHQHFPAQGIPTTKQERAKLHQLVDPRVLEAPAFQDLHVPFHTKRDLALELVRTAVERQLPFSVVLVDSGYLAAEVVRVLEELPKAWVSMRKRNRNLETNSFVLRDAAGAPMPFAGPPRKVEDLVPHLPASAYRAVTVGEQRYWCFTVTVRRPRLGNVRLVISFATADLTGTSVVLVTNRLDWSAHTIIATYMLRWPGATFYQDRKSYLGRNEYRLRNAAAIQQQWCLVCVAYWFVPVAGLPPPLKQASLPVKTIGEACRQQAQALIEAVLLYAHDHLQRGQHVKDVFARLFATQGLAVT